MSTWELPSWDECSETHHSARDALQDFIFENTPAGNDEPAFRESLLRAIMVAKDQIDALQSRSSPIRPSADQQGPSQGGSSAGTDGRCPTAWMRRVVSHHGPNDPDEIDYEFSYGDDQPDGASWIPLYRGQSL